jgi:hypothetical protein
MILVRLIGEGLEVKRLVKADELGNLIYLISEENIVPVDEEWEFPPGSVVRVEERKLFSGTHRVAVELIK